MEIEPIDGMAHGVDGFGSKLIRSLVFIKHCPCRFNECLVLSLHNTILLWSVWSQKLVFDPFFIKELFNACVLEFGSIVTSYSLDLHLKLILGSSCKFLEVFLDFTLVLQKEYPSETRIVINNYKTVFVTANAYVCHQPK